VIDGNLKFTIFRSGKIRKWELGRSPRSTAQRIRVGSALFNRSGFSHAGARRGSPSSRSPPTRKRDYYGGVTFLVEATRQADLIVVDHMIDKIEGNPFFMEEMVLSLFDQGH
jgi:hypothetical protein